ncbi:MAG TPA: GTP-dependent dephospho-CoA kinase family protein [Methanoregula sp.]|nr:GTP-dependent dephospho-CoA kinase family protein [Methanoregula sp.]
MLILPEEHRRLFKEPFGELFHGIGELLPRITGKTVYSVGDVVTHNLQTRGITPAIAVIDGHSMRTPCRRLPSVQGECIRVKNPAGTLTDELARALEHAVAHPPATIVVEGEEDLAVIPLVLAAPEGSIILYGQPGKGVVLRTVNAEAKKIARTFLNHFLPDDRIRVN